MTLTRLVRYGSLAAMLAGALRTISSFIPYNAASVPLEWFYLLIDVCLLLCLLSLYLYQHEQVGRVGFSGFLPALIGTASIIGPDGNIGNVDMYDAASLLISLGLSVFAIGVWSAGRLPRAVPVLWWLSTLIGVVGFAVKGPPSMFVLAGVAFGLAFVIAGLKLWTDSTYR